MSKIRLEASMEAWIFFEKGLRADFYGTLPFTYEITSRMSSGQFNGCVSKKLSLVTPSNHLKHSQTHFDQLHTLELLLNSLGYTTEYYSPILTFKQNLKLQTQIKLPLFENPLSKINTVKYSTNLNYF